MASESPPNVIVIMVDDIGFDHFSGSENELYPTPNVNKLAASGVRFTHAYAQPICTPSRVKIMTGQYNFRNYLAFNKLDLSQPTFAKMVKQAGYATAIAGKWQLSIGNLVGPYQAGFDEYCLWDFARSQERLEPPFQGAGKKYRSPQLYRNAQKMTDTAGKFGPDIVSDFILDFIERKKHQPFLVYYPMMLVHRPFGPTPDSRDWEAGDESSEPTEYFRQMVVYMDKLVGKIVAKLEETGLRDNTLIIVTSDNGTNTAIPSLKGGKGKMTDAGTRVAFVVNWPGQIEAGTVVDSPIDLADVMPTIAEVTGSTLPAGSDGQSLVPLLRGDDSGARGWVFMSYSRKGPASTPFRYFVRDREWKLYANGRLYHVPRDLLELHPVSGPAGESARQRLQPILDRILEDETRAPR